MLRNLIKDSVNNFLYIFYRKSANLTSSTIVVRSLIKHHRSRVALNLYVWTVILCSIILCSNLPQQQTPHCCFPWLRCIQMIWIRLNDPRSLLSWCIKGTSKSLPIVDSSVPLIASFLMDHSTGRYPMSDSELGCTLITICTQKTLPCSLIFFTLKCSVIII